MLQFQVLPYMYDGKLEVVEFIILNYGIYSIPWRRYDNISCVLMLNQSSSQFLNTSDWHNKNFHINLLLSLFFDG
jgi:hypothetical protein